MFEQDMKTDDPQFELLNVQLPSRVRTSVNVLSAFLQVANDTGGSSQRSTVNVSCRVNLGTGGYRPGPANQCLYFFADR
jgi:hypothetical protein